MNTPSKTELLEFANKALIYSKYYRYHAIYIVALTTVPCISYIVLALSLILTAQTMPIILAIIMCLGFVFCWSLISKTQHMIQLNLIIADALLYAAENFNIMIDNEDHRSNFDDVMGTYDSLVKNSSKPNGYLLMLAEKLQPKLTLK